MVFPESDVVAEPIRLKDDREVVVRIFIDFGSLVLMLDVLDRQWVEIEVLFQQLEVLGIGALDIEPHPFLMGLGETSIDRARVVRVLSSLRRQ
jgi:hypothetical protein